MINKLITVLILLLIGGILYYSTFSGRYITCQVLPGVKFLYESHYTNKLTNTDQIKKSVRLDQTKLYCNVTTYRSHRKSGLQYVTYILSTVEGSTFASKTVDTFDSLQNCKKTANEIMSYMEEPTTKKIRIDLYAPKTGGKLSFKNKK